MPGQLCGLVAGFGVAAGAAAATYPASLERADVLSWLRRDTDIAPAQVVAVNATAVTAVVFSEPAGRPKSMRVGVRYESLDPQAAARGEPLSWHTTVELDCASGRVRLGPTLGYAERNLHGPPRLVRPADADWVTPSAGAPLDAAWRSACGKARPPAGAPAVVRASAPDAPSAASSARAASAAAMPAAAVTRPAAAAVAPKPAPAGRPPALGDWRGSVQVVSAFSAAEARRVLDRLRAHAPVATLRLAVEPATVGGVARFRGVLSGFASPAAARQLCETLRAGGQPCLVRGR